MSSAWREPVKVDTVHRAHRGGGFLFALAWVWGRQLWLFGPARGVSVLHEQGSLVVPIGVLNSSPADRTW
jgi:hypothetical protein